MTTSELIKELQAIDPDGDKEVVLYDGSFIHDVDYVPASYDGLLQSSSRDDEGNYTLKISNMGWKVRLHARTYEDLLFDYPESRVDLSDLDENRRKDWERIIEVARKEGLRSDG